MNFSPRHEHEMNYLGSLPSWSRTTDREFDVMQSAALDREAANHHADRALRDQDDLDTAKAKANQHLQECGHEDLGDPKGNGLLIDGSGKEGSEKAGEVSGDAGQAHSG